MQDSEESKLTRRGFCAAAALAGASIAMPGRVLAESEPEAFRLRYILASSLYGRLPIEEVVGEIESAGCEAIDIWPQPHADHREQIEALGYDVFSRILERAGARVGIYTCFNPGLLESVPWLRVAKGFGASMVIAHSGGPRDLQGEELKSELRAFTQRLAPLMATAEALGMTLGVENHSAALVNSPDSLRWFMEMTEGHPVGIALAPYHLDQDAEGIARIVRDLGRRLVHFYGWEHGLGSTRKMPKVMEMKQLPGYGALDFRPIVAALRAIDYRGWTSVFMHPFPRGGAILPTAGEVTAAINRSREYLDACVAGG